MIRKTVFITESVLAELQEICRRDGVTISDLFRRAVAEFLAERRPK